MFATRATLALGVMCAVAGFTSSANAFSCPAVLPGGVSACYDATDAAGLTVPFTPVTHNVGSGISGTDEYWIVIDGPAGVASPGSAGTAVLSFGTVTGLSSFSYQFTSFPSDAGGAPNASGSLSTSGSDSIPLDLTAASAGIPGAPFDHYRLLLSWTTSGSTGGGYNYSIQIDPCGRAGCASTVVPVPPAAVLFVSALAGLGLLGRRRRKSAHDLTAQA